MTERRPLVLISGRQQELPSTDTTPGTFVDAASDGKTYGRKNGTWSEVTSGSSSEYGKVPGGRLTLESGVPVSTTDQTAKTTLYYTPFVHDQLWLFTASAITRYTFSEISLSGPSLTSGKNYDVFCYDDAGTLKLELSAAWTNDSTKADALAWQAGVGWVKSADHSRFWLGMIRASATNQMSDTAASRLVWNRFRQVRRDLIAAGEATQYWDYGTATWRAANANTTVGQGRVEFVRGASDSTVSCDYLTRIFANAPNGGDGTPGVGLDSTTVNSAAVFASGYAYTNAMSLTAKWQANVAVGYHYLQSLEIAPSSFTTRFYGRYTNVCQSGLMGTIQC